MRYAEIIYQHIERQLDRLGRYRYQTLINEHNEIAVLIERRLAPHTYCRLVVTGNYSSLMYPLARESDEVSCIVYEYEDPAFPDNLIDQLHRFLEPDYPHVTN